MSSTLYHSIHCIVVSTIMSASYLPPRMYIGFDMGYRYLAGTLFEYTPLSHTPDVLKRGHTRLVARARRGKVRIVSWRLWDLYTDNIRAQYDKPAADGPAFSNINETQHYMITANKAAFESGTVFDRITDAIDEWDVLSTYGKVPIIIEQQPENKSVQKMLSKALRSAIRMRDRHTRLRAPYRFVTERAKKFGVARGTKTGTTAGSKRKREVLEDGAADDDKGDGGGGDVPPAKRMALDILGVDKPG